MRTDETVRDVCAEMHEQAQTWWGFKVPNFCDLHDTWAITADRILAAYDREMAAKDEEIARLKAAFKPVMECATKSAEGSMPNYIGCWDAVREAQRVMLEGGEK